ncbi:MAG: type II secretion system protein GspG [Acidobacteriota bacterium]
MLFGLLAACGKAGEEYSREVLHALEQGRLVGTRGTMETVARALEAYRLERGAYPRGATMREAVSALSPAYLRSPSAVDAWGRTLDYRSDGDTYTLTSPGPDGRSGSGDDLVMVDGAFTNSPPPGAR